MNENSQPVVRKKLFLFGKNGTICKGVVNPRTGKSSPPNTLDEQEYWDGVTTVIDKLKSEGHSIGLLSNEGGVAWNIFSEEDAELLVKAAATFINADAYRMCPFHPKGKIAQYAQDSINRLPQPGMIESLMHEFGFLPQDTLLVGDWTFEREAAAAAGCEFRWAHQFFNRTADPFADRMHAALEVK